MSACMASPIKLAHALNRKKGEEPPKTCLAAEELGDGILVPSRLYMYMNKDDVPVQPVAPAPRKLKKRGQRATDSSQHNGNAKARSSRAKRTATEAGIPDVAPCNGTNSGAKQQRANVPETQGQAADQVMADAADASKADDDDFEPLPPPKVAPKYLQRNGCEASRARPAAVPAPEDTAMEQPARSGSSTPSQPAASAAAAQHEDAQGAAAEQPASHANEASGEAGAACLLKDVDGPAVGLGECSSAAGRSGARTLITARKGHNPSKQMGPPNPDPPPAKSNLGPPAKRTGKARKSILPAAPGAEGQPGEAPREPVAPEEELQGASEEDIARVNIEYNLTTPHEVTAEEAEASQKRLEAYRVYCTELKAQGQKKEDMRGFKDKKVELGTPLAKVGHIPGFKAGDKFRNKGELAIAGIHCNIAGGIYYLKNDPVYAIVLSGGYKDDADGQKEIIYTGQGGQKNGVQVEDQDWVRGNLNLKIAFERGTPVRVCRGAGVEKTYDGLYRITRAWKERGKDSFIICRFCMVPIPGHSHVSQIVQAKVVNTRRRFRVVQGFEDDEVRAARELMWLEEARTRPGFIKDDIAGGAEKIGIPAFNEIDDTPLDPLEYIRHSVIGSEAAQQRAELGKQYYQHSQCGRKRMGNSVYIGTTSLLKKAYINCNCIYECVSGCEERLCELNKVVTNGISAPLEVFYTGKQRGWGLRCARDMRPGEFVCEYTGEIITTEEAEAVDAEQNHDKYLYDLKDFSGQATPNTDPDMVRIETPPVPPNPEHPEKPTMDHLTIDARTKGNVGRFMNHHCGGGNVVGRTVLAEGDSGLMYRVAMFTHTYVPAGTELTYDYQWEMKQLELPCLCGHTACKGWVPTDGTTPAAPGAAAENAAESSAMPEGTAAGPSAMPEQTRQPEVPACNGAGPCAADDDEIEEIP